jgi:hypothetical protein
MEVGIKRAAGKLSFVEPIEESVDHLRFHKLADHDGA